MKKKYDKLDFKIPVSSKGYNDDSKFIIQNIESILSERINTGRNKIILNTNLKLGLPMENINKIAEPIVEAWTYEVFSDVFNNNAGKYSLINVEACKRLDISDIILQFQKMKNVGDVVTANVDVKATSEDIETSGLSPNITSFARIRSEYVNDPDFIFVILSLKHRVYSQKNSNTHLFDAVMDIKSFNAYDLKFLSEKDISYNPALGTGQIQIRDVRYVSTVIRTTWDFCKMLDKKFITSKKGFNTWFKLAIKNEWIKNEK
jgi:hypothetical protein